MSSEFLIFFTSQRLSYANDNLIISNDEKDQLYPKGPIT